MAICDPPGLVQERFGPRIVHQPVKVSVVTLKMYTKMFDTVEFTIVYFITF